MQVTTMLFPDFAEAMRALRPDYQPPAFAPGWYYCIETGPLIGPYATHADAARAGVEEARRRNRQLHISARLPLPN